MLCQFSFENFRSFKNEALLDFCAENITEHTDSLIEDSDKEKFLPIISIYGPNGGGKSTVLEALVYLKMFILRHSMVYMNESANIIEAMQKRYSEPQYYLFRVDSDKIPMKFDVLFRHKGIEYRYMISILNDQILTEELYYRNIGEKDANLLIDRGTDYCNLAEDLNIPNVDQIKRTIPLITYIGSTFDNKIIGNAIEWFYSILNVNYDEPGRDKSVFIPAEGNPVRKHFINILNDMDIPIKEFRAEKDDQGRIRNLYTLHENEGRNYELDFKMESSGSRKIISCLRMIMDCLEQGRLLIADELDAKLHPSLLRYIIKLFTDASINKNQAQLLITSHDIVNMTPEIFRRDEIWFCAMGMDSSSNLYSLVSFRNEKGLLTRKDAIYSKQYMEGKYGADPYIRKVSCWEEPR